MRVKSASISGSGSNELTVIRGALGTIQESHSSGELLRKSNQYQSNLDDHLLFVQLVIHLNILDSIQVTTQLQYHRFRSEHSQKEKSSQHSHKRDHVVLLFTQV